MTPIATMPSVSAPKGISIASTRPITVKIIATTRSISNGCFVMLHCISDRLECSFNFMDAPRITPRVNRITFQELADDMINDYKVNKSESLRQSKSQPDCGATQQTGALPGFLEVPRVHAEIFFHNQRC